MKINKLNVKKLKDAWEVTFPERGMKELAAEEEKLFKLLTSNMSYVDIMKSYSLSTETIFCYISSMHRRFIIKKGKEAADNFLYMAMLKLCGVTDERVNHCTTPVIDKFILLDYKFNVN